MRVTLSRGPSRRVAETTRAPRGAEIAVGELTHPPPVLDVPRLVEAEEALELGDHGGAGDGVGADHLLDDGAGHEAQHEEHEQGQPQERQGHRVQPDDEVSSHSAPCRGSNACSSSLALTLEDHP